MYKKSIPACVVILLTLGSLACTLTAQNPSKQAALASVATVQPDNQPVSKISPSPTPAASLTPADGGGAVCLVTAQALNVRACPGVDCAVIAWLRSGQAVNAAPAGPGWLLVDLADGQPGYIAARYCDGGQP